MEASALAAGAEVSGRAVLEGDLAAAFAHARPELAIPPARVRREQAHFVLLTEAAAQPLVDPTAASLADFEIAAGALESIGAAFQAGFAERTAFAAAACD